MHWLLYLARAYSSISGRAGRHLQADWSTLQGSGTLKSLRHLLLQEPRCKAQLAFGKDASSPSRSHSQLCRSCCSSDLFFSVFRMAAPPDAWVMQEHQPLFLNALEAVAIKFGIQTLSCSPAICVRAAHLSRHNLSDLPGAPPQTSGQ